MKALTISLFLSLSIASLDVLAESVVTTSKAEQLVNYPSQSAPAKVVALNQAMVPTQISAVLNRLAVKVGDAVVKGDTLAELDCRNFKLAEKAESARLIQAQNQKAFALREFKRGEKLAKDKNIGEAELDRRKTVRLEADAAVSSQQASLELAKINVERCIVKAPFDGIVLKRMANEGEMLDTGKPIVELLQQSNLEVSAKIGVSDLASFKNASEYAFVSDDSTASVSLRQVLPFIENNTRSREARFLLDYKDKVVGSIGRLQWSSPIAHLPAHLLQIRQGVRGYFVENSGKAVFVQVANAEEGRPIPFASSLQDAVIVDGRHGLNHGDDVRVVAAEQTGER